MIHINKNSLIDYLGKTAVVLGFPGCNLRCPYCQNPELALADTKIMPEDDNVLSDFCDLAITHYKVIDGVVFSGGEPTLHSELLQLLCSYWKAAGYPVKIDTNGTKPDVISELIERKLIDYVAVSLKYDLTTLQAKYVWIDTLPMLVDSGINFEVRVVAVADKVSESKSVLSFEQCLLNSCEILRDDLGIKKLKLHRHNRQAKILNPAFYEGVRMYDESDYQRLKRLVEDHGLECELV